jgi:very-short-patch-repair endonuclease
MDLFGPRIHFFPQVEQMKAYCTKNKIWWYSLNDVYKVLENTSGQPHILKFAKEHECIQLQQTNREWNQVENKWEISNNSDMIYMIPNSHLVEMVTLIVNRTRKSLSQKSDVCLKLNVTIPESNLKVPIECSMLDIFTKACPFKVELQYRLGKYKLDAFIPRLKIAIQIDENNHSQYDQLEEKEYDTVIRDHHIICIRFVPDKNKELDSALKLVNIVWQRTLSPDFVEFKSNHSLA